MPNSEGFDVILHEGATEIRLKQSKAMDTAGQQHIVDELLEYVQREQPVNLVINFIKVRRCATVAINGLLAVRRLLGSDDTTLKLCHVCQEVRQTLDVLNLTDSVFEVHETLADAIGSR